MEAQTISVNRVGQTATVLEDGIDLSILAPVQRMLLTTDGTLTKLLEAYLLETIQIVKLAEQFAQSATPQESLITTQTLPQLELEQGSPILQRSILLQGKNSRKNFIYAESMLVVERLPYRFKQELTDSETPLGRLLLKHRIETFKELLVVSREPAHCLSSFFQIERQDYLLSRTYCLSCHARPVMLITEKFPERYFK